MNIEQLERREVMDIFEEYDEVRMRVAQLNLDGRTEEATRLANDFAIYFARRTAFATPVGAPKGPLGQMGERGKVIGESSLVFRQAIKYKGE